MAGKKCKCKQAVYYRINKLSAGEWELIELRDGKEIVLRKDHNRVVSSKFQALIRTQPVNPPKVQQFDEKGNIVKEAE